MALEPARTPRYPAVAFVFGGRAVVPLADSGALAMTTPSQLSSGFFRAPFHLIDSSLEQWMATPSVPSLTLWGLLLNRQVPLTFHVTSLGLTSLTTLQSRVVKALYDDPTSMWAGGDRSVEEMAAAVQAATSVRALFAELDWPGRLG